MEYPAFYRDVSVCLSSKDIASVARHLDASSHITENHEPLSETLVRAWFRRIDLSLGPCCPPLIFVKFVGIAMGLV